MKKIWLNIKQLVGLKADVETQEVEGKISMSEEELKAIESKLEEGKGHLEAKDKAEADLKASIEAKDKAEADLKAANEKLEASEKKVTDLEAKVKELGEKPGAEIVDLKAEAGEDDPAAWMTDEVKAAGHNQFAADALGIDLK